MNNQKSIGINLAAPCGIYCGTCRHYLAREKGLLMEKKLKQGSKGCRIQDKNCSWIKKGCELIRKKQIGFYFECKDFPCTNHKNLYQRHLRDDKINLIDNLLRIKDVGAGQWLKEQEEKWSCPQCGGDICVMDQECYDCGYEVD
jgi:hypothetical protein